MSATRVHQSFILPHSHVKGYKPDYWVCCSGAMISSVSSPEYVKGLFQTMLEQCHCAYASGVMGDILAIPFDVPEARVISVKIDAGIVWVELPKSICFTSIDGMVGEIIRRYRPPWLKRRASS